MKSLKQLAAKAALGLAAFGGVFGVMATPGKAQADPYVYHYYTPRIHVARVYAPRVFVPRFVAPPAIHVQAYHPGFAPWTPGGAVIIRSQFHFDAPYAPVVLPW